LRALWLLDRSSPRLSLYLGQRMNEKRLKMTVEASRATNDRQSAIADA
jgi:hypothetical protein